jgi:hypothetical protein
MVLPPLLNPKEVVSRCALLDYFGARKDEVCCWR